MSGRFAQAQPAYAERGIATFPLGPDKRPAVRSYGRIGLRGSAKLARKFPDADALGFMLGRQSGLTVLDVDTPDERILGTALDRHGSTPVIVRSARGHFHAFYRHQGERRLIRPLGAKPIDLLGEGLLVAPPSEIATGQYCFVQGGLDDLQPGGLPAIRGLGPEMYTKANAGIPSPAHRRIDEGHRNDELFHYCMQTAPSCGGLDELKSRSLEFNRVCLSPQLRETEVLKTAASAWGYERRGRNRLGRAGTFIPMEVIDDLIATPQAFTLLAFLSSKNGPDSRFCITDGLASVFDWPRRALPGARDLLLTREYVMRVQRRAPGRAATYRWGKTYQNR